MDLLYSATLLISFTCGVATLAAALLHRLRSGFALGWARLVVPGAVAAWGALMTSLVVHFAWGHTPGTPQALPPLEFLREHVSFIVAAALPGVALVVQRGYRRASSAAQG